MGQSVKFKKCDSWWNCEIINNFDLHLIYRFHCIWIRTSTKLTTLFWTFNDWVISFEEVFKVFIVFKLENLCLISTSWIIEYSSYALINLKYLWHCPQPLTASDSLNFCAIEICISQDLHAINMKKFNFESSHNAKTALYLAMLPCHYL